MSTRVDVGHLGDLKQDPNNAKVHNERNLASISTSITETGFGRSLVIANDDTILAGNATAEALADLDMTEYILVESDGTKPIVHKRIDLASASDAMARKLAFYDNRTAELASGWDTEVLAALMQEVDIAAVAMTPEEAADLIASDGAGQGTEGLTDPDEVPEPPVEPTTRPGDLWRLGEHRLLCGDSTVVTDLDRLLSGTTAQLVFTDPPYGVDYEGGTKVREKLVGDHAGTSIYADVLSVLPRYCDPKAPLYLWHADRTSMPVLQALHDSGWEVRAQIIWRKNLAQFGSLSAQYKQQHEPCFYGHRRGQAPYWYGPTNEVTVWDVDRAPKNEYHPTQKPVELAARAMRNSSQPGDIVLDLFGGSGSTLIAAEQDGRRARLMELDPRYCDVIIRRWENFSGGTAELERAP